MSVLAQGRRYGRGAPRVRSIYKKAAGEGSNKTIPTEWLGSDLSAYYQAGFRPSL
jgi:hypothetical protein